MSELSKIRVLCIDDHPLFLEGIGRIIEYRDDMTVVGTASNAADALTRHRELLPDVTLMDLRLPGGDGISAMVAIRGEVPTARVIMLTTFEGDVEVQRALSAGASGYMLKTMPPADLVAGIRTVHSGRKYIPADIVINLTQSLGSELLTRRELDVLRELAEGNRNRDIGARLSITEETVKGHVQRILEKLGAQDRTQAVSIGLRRGIIHL